MLLVLDSVSYQIATHLIFPVLLTDSRTRNSDRIAVHPYTNSQHIVAARFVSADSQQLGVLRRGLSGVLLFRLPAMSDFGISLEEHNANNFSDTQSIDSRVGRESHWGA